MRQRIEFYQADIEAVWSRLATTNAKHWVRALWTVDQLAGLFPSAAKSYGQELVKTTVDVYTVEAALEAMVAAGDVARWQLPDQPTLYVLSAIGAAKAGLRLHADSSRWLSRRSKAGWDNDRELDALRKAARSPSCRDPMERHPDPTCRDPATLDWDRCVRPRVLLGERLQWNGPAWAESSPCPGCAQERQVVDRLRRARGRGVRSRRADGALDEIGSRYCLVCDNFVRNNPVPIKGLRR